MSGVRRSWLAAATSSRCARRSPSSAALISLTTRGHLAQLARARDRRARLELAVGEALRGAPAARASGSEIERETSSAPTSAEADAAAATSVIERVVARVEHDQPGGDDGDERQPRGEQREAGQPQAQRRQQPQGKTADDAGAPASRARA